MTTIRWRSDCCNAVLDSYKDTECPDCGEPCTAEAPDMEPDMDANAEAWPTAEERDCRSWPEAGR